MMSPVKTFFITLGTIWATAVVGYCTLTAVSEYYCREYGIHDIFASSEQKARWKDSKIEELKDKLFEARNNGKEMTARALEKQIAKIRK